MTLAIALGDELGIATSYQLALSLLLLTPLYTGLTVGWDDVSDVCVMCELPSPQIHSTWTTYRDCGRG